jgi:hypothetical protein
MKKSEDETKENNETNEKRPFFVCFVIFFCFVFSGSSASVCSAQEFDQPPQDATQAGPPRWQWSFTVRNRTGYRLEEPRVFQMSRTTFNAKGRYKIDDDWQLTLEGFAQHDPVDRLGYPKVWFDPRQVLVDGKIKKIDLKLGLQQVVWGQSDGLRVLDVINPLDYREFILEDFLDSRRPLWLARADAPVGKGSLQMIWVPYFAPGRIPVPDDEFNAGPSFGLGLIGAASGIQNVDRIPLRVEPTARPAYQLKSSQAGARYSRSIGSWDLTANYFYGWEDIPTNYLIQNPQHWYSLSPRRSEENEGSEERAINMPSSRSSLSSLLRGEKNQCFKNQCFDLVFQPKYDRKEVFGGTAATNFGSMVLRMEAGWNRDKPTAVKSGSPTGIDKFGQFSGVVGLDYSAKTWLWISGQYFLQFTSAPQERLLFPRYNHLASIYFRANFLRETLRPELFILTGLNQEQYLIRPRVVKTFGDHWSLGAGADFLGGKQTNIFGYFDTKDRVVVELKWMM